MMCNEQSAVGQGALLSPRLRQTLVCLLDGSSEKEAAARLGLSPTTLHQYVTALYRHFGVRSRAQLLARVLRHLEPPHWDELLSASGSGPALLSPRLQATLVCLLDGQSEKEVAAQLGVSPTTIHQYVSALYRRFGVASRAQLLGQILQRLTGGCREQLLERLAGQGAHGHA
jgi:DNA-binding NarL/FixJ family response regulator